MIERQGGDGYRGDVSAGVADAERGELHPFYYQHYYHYRRGYDRTRRYLRRPGINGSGWRRGQLALVVLVLIAVGSGAFMVLRARSQPSAAPATALTMPTVRVAATAIVRTPIFPRSRRRRHLSRCWRWAAAR